MQQYLNVKNEMLLRLVRDVLCEDKTKKKKETDPLTI